MPLANPAAKLRAEHHNCFAGLGLHLFADRVITKLALHLTVFIRDLLHVVEVVPLVGRQPQVGVNALLLLAGVGAMSS